MAGIGGVLDAKPSDDDGLIGRMAATLTHSARAKTEIWSDSRTAFCRVRSGIDNPEPQPVFGRSREKCIVFFGECFGYDQKKAELIRNGHRFEFDSSDAEYCLALHAAEGEAAFAQLSGSFCFAIYDLVSRELLVVSDRLGTRPVYYALTPGGRLVFATQVSAILRSPDVSRELDAGAAAEFCALQRVLGTKTLHKQVAMLPPASVLCFREGTIDVRPYWTLRYRSEPGTAEDYAEELAAVFRRSVGHVCRGGARVALLLSGGLDARMVVAAAETKLHCVTFGDYENPEAETARQVASAKGWGWQFLRRGADHYFRLIEPALDIGSGMHAFNHAHAIGFVDEIAQQFDVVTHGYVPELFFRGTSLPKVARRIGGLEIGKRLDPTLSASNLAERIFFRGYSLLPGAAALLTPAGRQTLSETLAADAGEMIGRATAASADVYDWFLWPDVQYHARYPSMLFEMALRPYLTERSFVFQNEVLDLHLRMPRALRSDNTVWLKAMRKLDGRVAGVRDANTGFSPFLPPVMLSLINAGVKLAPRLPLVWRLAAAGTSKAESRRGLSPISWPRFDWMISNHKGIRELITATLTDGEALPAHLFDAGAVRHVLDEHLAGARPNRNILFALLTLGLWHKKHVAA